MRKPGRWSRGPEDSEAEASVFFPSRLAAPVDPRPIPRHNRAMAKCVKCNQRKGKRYCPALGSRICARCCGTHRLEEIRCPPDCSYLAGEAARREREKDRRSVAVKRYFAERSGTFSTEDEQFAVFALESITYLWWKDNPRADAESVAESYERAARMLGRIALPGDVRDSLAADIVGNVESGPAFHEGDWRPSHEFLAGCLRRLAGFVREYESHAGPLTGYRESLEFIFSRVPPVPVAEAEERGSSRVVLPGRAPPPERPAGGGLIVLPGE